MRLGKSDLNEAEKLSVKELMKVKGIGEPKAISIAAALGLGRRRQAIASREKTVISTRGDVARYM